MLADRRAPPRTEEGEKKKEGLIADICGTQKKGRKGQPTLSSSFSPLSLIKTFSSSWLMPSMLLGTLEMEGFGTVMLDSGIWADLDMEKCWNVHKSFV